MMKLVKVVSILVVLGMLISCGSSMNILKNRSSAEKVQTAECMISVAAPTESTQTKIKILEPVIFDFDKFNIRSDQKVVINKVAALMTEYPDTILIIKGYASNEGPDPYNMGLSQRRANSVKSALVEQGINPDNIKSVIGLGETSIFGDILGNNRRALVLSVE